MGYGYFYAEKGSSFCAFFIINIAKMQKIIGNIDTSILVCYTLESEKIWMIL